MYIVAAVAILLMPVATSEIIYKPNEWLLLRWQHVQAGVVRVGRAAWMGHIVVMQ